MPRTSIAMRRRRRMQWASYFGRHSWLFRRQWFWQISTNMRQTQSWCSRRWQETCQWRQRRQVWQQPMCPYLYPLARQSVRSFLTRTACPQPPTMKLDAYHPWQRQMRLTMPPDLSVSRQYIAPMPNKNRSSGSPFYGQRQSTVERWKLHWNCTMPRDRRLMACWWGKLKLWSKRNTKALVQVMLPFTIMLPTLASLVRLLLKQVRRGPFRRSTMALCAAFASYMSIQQVNNCEGTNKRGKMAPIIAKMMSIDVELAQELLRRIAWDTAIDMSCNKLNFA